MKKPWSRLPMRAAAPALMLLLAAWLTLPGPTDAAESPALMLPAGSIEVIDGDGLRSGHTSLRLWGIDAAELDTGAGRKARSALAALIAGQDVHCWPALDWWPAAAHRPDCPNRARTHGRIVAICTLADGRDLARELVAGGWAVDWPRYSCGYYADSEAAARHAGRGLWPAGELPPARLRELSGMR